MAVLPDVVLTVQDGALGIVPAVPTNTQVSMGICSAGVVGTLYSFNDSQNMQSTLGTGPVVECGATKLSAAGGPQLFIPVNPSQFGFAGTVTLNGSGFGLVTVTLAPSTSILITITTAGVLATMKFTYQVGSGPVSQPVTTTAGSFVFLVPGTQTTLTFAAGTYVINSTYTIGTDGSVTLGGGAIAAVTQQSSPNDSYSVQVIVQTTGGVTSPAATFKYSLDAGNTLSGSIQIPATGKYAIPGTGLVLNFSQHSVVITITTPGVLGTAVYSYAVDGGGAVTAQPTTPNSGGNYVVTIPGTGLTLTFAPGSYVNASTYTISALGVLTLGGGAINTVTMSDAAFFINDIYSFLASPAGFTNTDVTNAFVTLLGLPSAWFMVHVVGMPATAAASASLAAVVDTQLTTAATNFRYAFGLVDCPTLGTIITSGSAAIADVADTDTVVSNAFTSFTSVRCAVAAGDCALVSPLSGRINRRPGSWPLAARLSLVSPGEDAGKFARGALPSVRSLYRDEQATPALDAARFCTLRSFVGQPGYYVTNAWTMALVTSDFRAVTNRRVMDLACNLTRTALLKYLLAGVRVSPTTGFILEQDAQAIEKDVNGQLYAGVVATTPPNASATSIVLARNANLLSTSTEPVTVRITPLAYMRSLAVNIGFFNPSLQ